MLDPVPRGLWFIAILLFAVMAMSADLSRNKAYTSHGPTMQEETPDPGRIVVAPLMAAITLDFAQPKLPWSPEKKMSQQFDFGKKMWSEAIKKISQMPIEQAMAISIALFYDDANPMNDERLASCLILFAKPGDSNIRDCLIAEPSGLKRNAYLSMNKPGLSAYVL